MKALIIAVLLALLLTGCPGPAPDINTLHCKSDYTPYVLINNPSARDVSYNELVTFLVTFKPEVLSTKTCGHYAEDLHNYSESQGIRCAIVIAKLPDWEMSHAFNGFQTDGKMTYVDAGAGVISIAVKDSDGLMFVKDYGNQVQTQKVGQESDFEVFWC
jgi:hypothetical protein